jgi:hypothetical protein
VLNLTIVMIDKQRLFLFMMIVICASLLCLNLSSVTAQSGTPTPTKIEVGISLPLPGSALQGMTQISGYTAIEDFSYSEITFSYQNNSLDTWFLIEQQESPIANGTLALWDTNQISDGNYIIRLEIYQKDGSKQTYQVPDIRIRNDTPVETDTPLPPTNTLTLTPTSTISPKPTNYSSETAIPHTTTPAPPNPAQISKQLVLFNIGKGALVTLGVFILLGIYQHIKAINRKRYRDE